MKNNKGFTLIELLAVIVIMGILMLVAIPTMSKVIENSRKDTFIETAQTYVNSVNTLWKADGLFCGGEGISPSSLPAGNYYVKIDSKNEDLMERGGKSSWGNKEVKGYVRVNIKKDHEGNSKATYHVALTDGVHGVKEITEDSMNLRRSDIILDLEKNDPYFDKDGVTTCVVDGTGQDGEVIDESNLIFKRGDIFSTVDEEFQVISSTKTSLTLLAKYNIETGKEYRDNKFYKDYNRTGSGKQNEDFKGFNPYKPHDPVKGTIEFGKTNKISGSTIEKYLDNYHKRLRSKAINIPRNSVRLLTKEEVEKMEVNIDFENLLHSGSYWTQSTYGKKVYAYDPRRGLRLADPTNEKYYGLRPVIILNDIQNQIFGS